MDSAPCANVGSEGASRGRTSAAPPSQRKTKFLIDRMDNTTITHVASYERLRSRAVGACRGERFAEPVFTGLSDRGIGGSGRRGRSGEGLQGPFPSGRDIVVAMTSRAYPFLMFQGGVAREAIDFYVSLFEDGEIVELTAYGADGPGPEGTVHKAQFRLAGQDFFASDSFITHDFGFTPSFSIWVEAESEGDLERVFASLAEGGQELMPVGDYGFSARFGWVNDRFGVSWQLNLS